MTDGERVIASHGSAGLVCYDLELLAVNKKTGEKVWQVDEPDGDSGLSSGRFVVRGVPRLSPRLGIKTS